MSILTDEDKWTIHYLEQHPSNALMQDALRLIKRLTGLNETAAQLFFKPIGMIICPTCGNKRCPHANDPANACTNSNEPGQQGSAYPRTSMFCDSCGADRFREDCKGDRQKCPIHGVAQDAQS